MHLFIWTYTVFLERVTIPVSEETYSTSNSNCFHDDTSLIEQPYESTPSSIAAPTVACGT